MSTVGLAAQRLAGDRVGAHPQQIEQVLLGDRRPVFDPAAVVETGQAGAQEDAGRGARLGVVAGQVRGVPWRPVPNGDGLHQVAIARTPGSSCVARSLPYPVLWPGPGNAPRPASLRGRADHHRPPFLAIPAVASDAIMLTTPSNATRVKQIGCVVGKCEGRGGRDCCELTGSIWSGASGNDWLRLRAEDLMA